MNKPHSIKNISPNVSPFIYSNLLRMLFSLELRLNNDRTFCPSAGVSDYCHVGLLSCQTSFRPIYGSPLGLLPTLPSRDSIELR